MILDSVKLAEPTTIGPPPAGADPDGAAEPSPRGSALPPQAASSRAASVSPAVVKVLASCMVGPIQSDGFRGAGSGRSESVRECGLAARVGPAGGEPGDHAEEQ